MKTLLPLFGLLLGLVWKSNGMTFDTCVQDAEANANSYKVIHGDCFFVGQEMFSEVGLAKESCGPDGFLAVLPDIHDVDQLKLLAETGPVFVGLEKDRIGQWKWTMPNSELVASANPQIPWAGGQAPGQMFTIGVLNMEGLTGTETGIQAKALCQYRKPTGMFVSELMDKKGGLIGATVMGLAMHPCSTLCHEHPECVAFAAPKEASTSATCELYNAIPNEQQSVSAAGYITFLRY